jgi:RNA ligase (TIGR02306 family)
MASAIARTIKDCATINNLWEVLNMRKLASIQKIKEIRPIEGADSIEGATVLGWQLVVKKGEFQVGDYCVYCEIDSVLPEKPEFEFLRPRKFRIKTVKLRGQVSQGIAFPISIIPNHEQVELQEGLDVTELVGVTKYEPPLSLDMKGKVKGGFPGFIPKTDETRIQSVPDVLTRPENQSKQYYVSEKVDGTSATYYIKDGEFGVCSRNLELLDVENNPHWMVAHQYGIEAKLRDSGRNVAIQGEVIGPKIQGNKYKLSELKFMIFNVFDIDKNFYLGYTDFVDFVANIGLESVPILQDDYSLGQNVVELVAMSEGQSVVNPKTQREGIVIRPIAEATDPELGRLSFKTVNPKFLLKYGE